MRKKIILSSIIALVLLVSTFGITYLQEKNLEENYTKLTLVLLRHNTERDIYGFSTQLDAFQDGEDKETHLVKVVDNSLNLSTLKRGDIIEGYWKKGVYSLVPPVSVDLIKVQVVDHIDSPNDIFK